MNCFSVRCSAVLGAGALLAGIAGFAPELMAEPGAGSCAAPSEATRLVQPLPRVAGRLARRAPLTIVAIGSSSTAGAGASAPTTTYPARLELELSQQLRGLAIDVRNRGVNGEETPEMVARFDRSVIAEHPDLVLWQVGTNSVLQDRELVGHAPLIHEGLALLKASGVDVVLVNPQYAPKVLAKPEAYQMVDLISLAAKRDNVDLFHRFAIMRHWHETELIPFEEFLSPDLLHMNDWSYACLAKLLAGAIVEASTRAPVTAGAPIARN
jgi:acyl-CoA thioesterase I